MQPGKLSAVPKLFRLVFIPRMLSLLALRDVIQVMPFYPI